ncbi:MAG: lactonase family protein [Oliverpabstia sp.]
MSRYLIGVGTLDFRTYAGDYGVHLLTMDSETGELQLQESIYNGLNASFLDCHTNGKMIYAVSERLEEGKVAAYKVNEEHMQLELINILDIEGTGCVNNVVTEDGNYVLVACWKSSQIYLCKINEEGAVERVSDHLQMPQGRGKRERQSQSNPHQVVLDRTQEYIVVPDMGADRLHIIKFEKERGKLCYLNNIGTSPGAGPRHAVFHPNNKWIYVLFELDSSIGVFEFDVPTGMLNLKQMVNIIPEGFWKTYEGPEIQGAEIQISSDGCFLFASVRGYYNEAKKDQIVRFTIDEENGIITGKKFFSCGGLCPRMFMFTPDEKYIICCNQADNEVVALFYEKTTGEIGEVCSRVYVREAAVVTILNT